MSSLLPCLAMMLLVSFRFSVAQIFHELGCTVYGNQDLLMYSNQDLLSQRETDLSPSLAVSGFWLFPASPNLSSGQMAQYKHTNANTQIQRYTNTQIKSVSVPHVLNLSSQLQFAKLHSNRMLCRRHIMRSNVCI